MKQILITLLAVAISCGALTETKALRSQGENRMKKLENLNHKLNKARSYLDVEALDRILADDWFGTLIWGNLVGKAAFLGELRSHLSQRGKEGLPLSHSDDEIRVRLYGDVAIVTGVLEQKYEGLRPFRLQYTNVYLKREGEWRAISTHESFAESNPPPVSSPDPKPPKAHDPILPKKP